MEYSFEEITAIQHALEVEFATLKDDANARYDLYTLRSDPTLPEDIAREGQVNVLSSLVIKSAHSIRSDLMANPTEFMVIPLGRDETGRVPVGDQRKADSLERALASLWARLNENRHVDREVYWHQLVSPFAIVMLDTCDFEFPEQGEDESDSKYAKRVKRMKANHVPFKVSTPDPLTCWFTERDGKTTQFVRRFKVLVKDVQDRYSHNKGAPRNEALRFKDGKWKWLSDDYEEFSFKQTASELMKEVEMITLDDGNDIYHVVLNDEDEEGEIVYRQPNPFGRVAAFVVRGSGTPLEAPEDRFEPFLWPLMQIVKDINYVRTMRATVSRNLAGPNNYIPLDPEIIKIFEDANRELPRTHRWRRGETPYLLGEVKDQPQHLDEDLDKLEERLSADLQYLLPLPSVNAMDPAVIKDAAATAILHAAEAGNRMYGPLMNGYASVIKDICESIEYCLLYHYDEDDDEVTTYSTGEEVVRGKNLKPGSIYTLNGDSVDFEHRVEIKIRGMSQAQVNAEYQLALSQWILPDGSKGVATIEDLIDAAHYPDKEEQKEKLAIEQTLVKIEPWIEEMALAAAIAEIETKLGIILPPPMMAGIMPTMGGENPNQTDPSGMPNQAQRMESPNIQGPEGGTENIA